MQKLIRPGCLLCLILFSLLLADGVCYGSDNSFQFWPSAGVAWEVNKDWTLNYSEQLRLNDRGGTLYYGQSDFGLIYKSLAEWLDIGVNYTVIYGYGEDADDTDEKRTSLSAILRGKILDRDVSDRLRLEYRDRAEKSNMWRFRNKFTVNRPFENLDTRGIRLLEEGLIKPYVADEIFVDLDGTGFSQNRVYLGIVTRLHKNMSTDFYYVLQTIKDKGAWENNNIIGVDFTCHF